MSAAGGSARRSTKPAESGPVSLPAPPRRSLPDFGCGSVGSMNEGMFSGGDIRLDVGGNMNKFSEKDWKLFRSKIAVWQEAYMEKLNKEYIELLSGEGNASDKFWALEKRIRGDKKDCGV